MDLFGKCDQIRWKLQIWSHLLEKSLIETLIFCAVTKTLRAGHPDTMIEAVSWHPFRQKARFPKRALFRDFSKGALKYFNSNYKYSTHFLSFYKKINLFSSFKNRRYQRHDTVFA